MSYIWSEGNDLENNLYGKEDSEKEVDPVDSLDDFTRVGVYLDNRSSQ